ncbi:MAP3K7IP3 [Mytilus edulis]|uniref:MAP3K7IP3 n=1 Tax=Mytilus edulis TaxID=6550 RepID=A0A8S3VBA7_MYTED|nr:MAP3K7IP3 [Mytilus edulis]
MLINKHYILNFESVLRFISKLPASSQPSKMNNQVYLFCILCMPCNAAVGDTNCTDDANCTISFSDCNTDAGKCQCLPNYYDDWNNFVSQSGDNGGDCTFNVANSCLYPGELVCKSDNKCSCSDTANTYWHATSCKAKNWFCKNDNKCSCSDTANTYWHATSCKARELVCKSDNKCSCSDTALTPTGMLHHVKQRETMEETVPFNVVNSCLYPGELVCKSDNKCSCSDTANTYWHATSCKASKFNCRYKVTIQIYCNYGRRMTTTEIGLNVQLLQDLKQKYPEVAEHVITLCVRQNKNDRKKCIEALDRETPNALFGNDQYIPNRLQDMHITDQRTRSDSASSGISSASTSSSSSHKIPICENPGNCIQNIECRVASPSPQTKTNNVPQGIRQIPVQHFQTIRSPQEKPSGSSQNPLVYNILYQQGDNRLPPSSHGAVGHPSYINQHGNINYSLQRSPITSQATMNQGPPVAQRSFSVQPLVEHGQLNIIRLQPGDRTPVYQPGNYNPSGLHGSHSEPYLTGMDNGTTPCNNYYTPLVVNVGTPPAYHPEHGISQSASDINISGAVNPPSFKYLPDPVGGTSHGDNGHFYPYYPNDSHISGHPPIASRSSSSESDHSVIGNPDGERRHVSTLTFQPKVVPSPSSSHSSLSSDSSHNHPPPPDIPRRQSGNIQEEAAYTQALISFQDDRMLKLKLDLESELRKLAKLRSQVNQMEKNMLENRRTNRSVNCSPSRRTNRSVNCSPSVSIENRCTNRSVNCSPSVSIENRRTNRSVNCSPSVSKENSAPTEVLTVPHHKYRNRRTNRSVNCSPSVSIENRRTNRSVNCSPSVSIENRRTNRRVNCSPSVSIENRRTNRRVNCSPSVSIENSAPTEVLTVPHQRCCQVKGGEPKVTDRHPGHDKEIDNYNNGLLPLGVCDPNALEQQNFFQNMNPGQRGSIFAPPPPDPPTSDSPPPPLPPRIHAIPPAPPQQPPTGSGDSDGDGEQWSCSACTLLNHPALNKCECCEMPRINSSPPSTGVSSHGT